MNRLNRTRMDDLTPFGFCYVGARKWRCSTLSSFYARCLVCAVLVRPDPVILRNFLSVLELMALSCSQLSAMF